MTEDTLYGPLSPSHEPIMKLRELSAVRCNGLAGYAQILNCDGDHVCTVPLSIDPAGLEALLNHGNSMYVKGVNRGREDARTEMRAALGIRF